jgi:hypothetical protein
MNHLQKLSFTILMTVGIYCLLTLPFFIAVFTMDIDTGHYYGLVYPTWLVFMCSVISIVIGLFINSKMSLKK